jgi:hypothetical protein
MDHLCGNLLMPLSSHRSFFSLVFLLIVRFVSFMERCRISILVPKALSPNHGYRTRNGITRSGSEEAQLPWLQS